MKRNNTLIFVATCLIGALFYALDYSSTPDLAPSKQAHQKTTEPKPLVAAPVFPQVPANKGDLTEACADCHPDHVEGFKKTGMGKSLYVMNALTITEPWTIDASETKHPTSNLTYRAFKTDDGRFWQEESLPGTQYRRKLEAVMAIGSGNHTRSYLSWLDGTLVQLPLTYYFDAKRWDLSPGYDTNNLRMSRPITSKCLFCHNDLSQTVADTIASYESPFAIGISCERCHGQGNAHIDYRMEGNAPEHGSPDPTILNPKHLSEVRQQQLCEQCHLQGRSRRLNDAHTWAQYDPRTPLHEYMTIYVERIQTDAFGIASHGARLQQSKCYQSGELGCSTCHNPHAPSTKAAYVKDCKGCHTVGCKNPDHTNGYCPQCHMPKGTPSDIPHVQFSDHFIRIASAGISSDPLTDSALNDPHATLRQQSPGERTLRRAIGNFDDLALQSSKTDSVSRQFVEANLPDAVAQFPDDWAGLDTLAQYHMARKNYAEASTTLERMVVLRPKQHEARLTLIRALALNGEIHRAKEMLQDVPQKLRFLTSYGDALAVLGNELSPTLLSQLVYFTQTYPANEEAALALANRAIKAGLMSKAMMILTKTLESDPLQFKVLFLAANLAYDERAYQQAVTYLSRILDSNPSLDAARWLRARCQRKLNRFTASVLDLEKVAQNQPQNESILVDYFQTLVLAKRQSEIPKRLDELRAKVPAETFQKLKKQFTQTR